MNLKKPTIAFHTLGCKVNYSETSFISNIFIDNNYVIKKSNEPADIYVINTCSVTESAVKKSRHIIHKVQHINPDALVIVTGCIADTDKEALSKIKGIDFIVNSGDKQTIFELINNFITSKDNSKIIFESNNNKNTFFSTYSSGDRTRSFLKIQDGCNYFCSYCIIPYARGNSRSDYVQNIVTNAEKITASGIKEIVLTGINIGDFKNNKNEKLIDVLKELSKIKNLYRLRLSSIEPDLLTDELIEYISKSENILPHFHLPLQSGSDAILKSMNRKYDTTLFEKKVEKLKRTIPDCCIGTDVICGFPGESNEDFETTTALINSLPLSYIHVFSFSKRKNTKADSMLNTIPKNIIKERADILMNISDKKKEIFYNSQKGKAHKILFEGSNNKGYMYGFSENYIKVKIKFCKTLVNKIVTAHLLHLDSDGTFLVDKKNISDII